ncbi:MAG: flagellar basal body P-ring protein FlgI [Zetaproteobacteria bacterium]|nr:MAG: flagellar basal body P-ring protein FlgI [Zetaproteobacteria bacterium]
MKDLADFAGVRGNALVGYGIVVGLNGTGDSATSAPFTVSSIVAMLEKLGVNVRGFASRLKPKNAAAVIVTAELPPFARPGTRIDVHVSSLGDAKSLRGGELLATPLVGGDGQVYAVAQGPVLVGGFAAGGQAASTTVNHPTVGRIPQGARVERPAPRAFDRGQAVVVLQLHRPDFTTALRMAEAINAVFGAEIAEAVDAGTVEVKNIQHDAVRLAARIEQIELATDQPTVVIVDERTGTVVMGGEVSLDPVAVSHGDISVTIREQPQVSQPAPFSEGETTTVPRTNVEVKEEKAKLVMLDRQPKLKDLVAALNAVGASPSDLIAVLQALKAAGALHAELRTL